MRRSQTAPAAGFRRAAVAGLLLLGAICSVLSLVRLVKASGDFAVLPGYASLSLAGLALAFLALSSSALYGLAKRRSPHPVDLRAGFALGVLGSLLYPPLVGGYSYGWALLWFAGLAALYSIWLLTRYRRGRDVEPRRRLLDLLAFNLSLTLVLLQLGLAAAAWLFPSSLLSVPGSADRLLASSRCPPGTVRFGFPCNSLGYYDEEPQSVPGTQVALVGDSFVLGIVPHSFLFSTVAEQLTGLRIDSFGVPRAGLPEYRIILGSDGLSVDPDIVVVAVFVGNDIAYSHQVRARHQGHAWLRAWLDRDQNLLWAVGTRLRRLFAELRTGRRLATLGEAGGSRGAANSGEAAGDYPWIEDYRLEEPTYSRPTYLELEQSPAEAVCGPESAAAYRSFFEDLEALAAQARGRGFAVLLIPGEFQVEDALWEAIEAAPEWDRDLPQQTIGPWLDARGIPCIDLLPVFRGVSAEPDGGRHLYHFQDTHLNARGNRVAGRELASALQRMLEQRPAR